MYIVEYDEGVTERFRSLRALSIVVDISEATKRRVQRGEAVVVSTFRGSATIRSTSGDQT